MMEIISHLMLIASCLQSISSQNVPHFMRCVRFQSISSHIHEHEVDMKVDYALGISADMYIILLALSIAESDERNTRDWTNLNSRGQYYNLVNLLHQIFTWAYVVVQVMEIHTYF